jgi:hypothetical protein
VPAVIGPGLAARQDANSLARVALAGTGPARVTLAPIGPAPVAPADQTR